MHTSSSTRIGVYLRAMPCAAVAATAGKKPETAILACNTIATTDLRIGTRTTTRSTTRYDRSPVGMAATATTIENSIATTTGRMRVTAMQKRAAAIA